MTWWIRNIYSTFDHFASHLGTCTHIAEAYKKAEELRGNGDAKATGIYADAYNKDPEFYEFTRSLKAYQSTFENKSDVLLIDPDSDFFKYLDSSKGKKSE